MNGKRARELAKSLIPDIDGIIAGESRPLEERHTAAASALLTVARLAGGLCINFARIADALEDIADAYCDAPAEPEPPVAEEA